jgi:BMFP domain-containing protein YqiC
MWVEPKGNAPTRDEFEALLERVRQLEQKLQAEPKRGRPPKEESKNG